ncbi:DUF349 domain-containing protein [Pseudoglutamicibacter cumminsii]|uniref:DUF349 domain-containing protein n=1 Tax=Pseudoglutamicibacter cumminsii TaxID=156979 RepID=UPI0021A3D428|nr:DUF349 domain-containing protein [Pseudoglutamicibacter cumminsii]MCT1685515.1 DUF349 domain-containing protein [Pseudoglutamicibacter cumminsii]
MTEQQPHSQDTAAQENTSPETAENTSTQDAQHETTTPTPSGAPTPAVPKAPTPSMMAEKDTAKESVIPAPQVPTTSLEEARQFARVTDDGHVFVIVDGNEHPVGQYPDASGDEALAYFVRKYDELLGEIMLLEQRVVAKAPTADMPKALNAIDARVKARDVVGDIAMLESRVENLRVAIDNLRQHERANAEQLRAEATEAREKIVVAAEELAAKPAEQVQWKSASQRMAELFDEWKAAQKNGHRLPRATEDELWKRFRSARNKFDKNRRTFFSKLDDRNAQAKRVKEELISRAESMQNSTDWGPTSAEYRKLMDEWKAAPRASRKDDDALWARFRAAQDVFFNARKKANDEIDAEYAENLKVKEALLEEARAILPVKDLKQAQRALGSIRDRWEAAGKVPRGDMHRIEAGLRQVEDAVRSAEQDEWRRTDPETKARSNSMLQQLEDAIADLEADLERAQASGDQRKVAKAQEALDARRAWLETVKRSAAELG